MNKLFYLLLGAAALAGCSKSDEVCGTYNGILPAADGPGIDVTLQLGPDNTFHNKQVYIDAEDGTFYDQGTYSRNGSMIELKSKDEIYYYKVEPGQLRMLNRDKQEVTGALAEHYILKKTQKCSGTTENDS